MIFSLLERLLPDTSIFSLFRSLANRINANPQSHLIPTPLHQKNPLKIEREHGSYFAGLDSINGPFSHHAQSGNIEDRGPQSRRFTAAL